jgi:hypothetical protein
VFFFFLISFFLVGLTGPPRLPSGVAPILHKNTELKLKPVYKVCQVACAMRLTALKMGYSDKYTLHPDGTVCALPTTSISFWISAHTFMFEVNRWWLARFTPCWFQVMIAWSMRISYVRSCVLVSCIQATNRIITTRRIGQGWKKKVSIFYNIRCWVVGELLGKYVYTVATWKRIKNKRKVQIDGCRKKNAQAWLSWEVIGTGTS